MKKLFLAMIALILISIIIPYVPGCSDTSPVPQLTPTVTSTPTIDPLKPTPTPTGNGAIEIIIVWPTP